MPQGRNEIRISVAEIPVEHRVKMADFTRWLEHSGGSPRDVGQRHKVRTILGVATR